MTVNIKEEVKAMQNRRTFKERAYLVIGRLEKLCVMLDKVRDMVEDIPEENSNEALKNAYKELAKAFAICIDTEQTKLTEEVEK